MMKVEDNDALVVLVLKNGNRLVTRQNNKQSSWWHKLLQNVKKELAESCWTWRDVKEVVVISRTEVSQFTHGEVEELLA